MAKHLNRGQPPCQRRCVGRVQEGEEVQTILADQFSVLLPRSFALR